MNHKLKTQQVVLSGEDYMDLVASIEKLEKENELKEKRLLEVSTFFTALKNSGVTMESGCMSADRLEFIMKNSTLQSMHDKKQELHIRPLKR